MDFEEDTLDLQKIFLIVQDLAEEKEELQAQVEELLAQRNCAENKLITASEQCAILEKQCLTFEESLEAQIQEKSNLNTKLQSENDRCQFLEYEIQRWKAKADAFPKDNFNESYEVKKRIKELEKELLKKEVDHARTQDDLSELSKRMEKTEVHRNKIREMQQSLIKAEKRLENVEWERKQEINERLLLEERERQLEKRNTELEEKLEEALLVLQKRQQELNETQRLQRASSLDEQLTGLTVHSDSDDGELLGNVEDLTNHGDEELVGNVTNLANDLDDDLLGNVEEMILAREQAQKQGLFECIVCNQFLVRYQQRCCFKTERILRRHEKTAHHKENVKRLRICAKRGRPLQQWDKKRRRRRNSQGHRRAQSFDFRDKRKPPIVEPIVNIDQFKSQSPYVEELTLEQIFKFQMTLNAMKEQSS